MNCFYHSAYTCEGFRWMRLNSLNPDCVRYVVKGHSQEIKNRLFKKIISQLEGQGIPFSASLNYNHMLTGIQCEEKGFIICDGTYPFSDDAFTYGATDGIIAVEHFQNKSAIRNEVSSIALLNEKILDNEKKCKRFIHAAAGVDDDKKYIEKENLDWRKISRYSSKLWSKYGCPPSGKVGLEKKVFFTVAGVTGFETGDYDISEICDTAILISGSSGVCCEMVIDKIRRYALSCGADVISSQSILNPSGTPEHIIVPALRFGVFGDNKHFAVASPVVKKVRSSRFYMNDTSETTGVRMQFNTRAYESLMKEVFGCIRKIENSKRELDEIYSSATDEKGLEEYVNSLLFDINR